MWRHMGAAAAKQPFPAVLGSGQERSRLSKLPAGHPGGGDAAVLSLSCIHGFMAADVPEMGTQILCVADGQPEKAAALAKVRKMPSWLRSWANFSLS